MASRPGPRTVGSCLLAALTFVSVWPPAPPGAVAVGTPATAADTCAGRGDGATLGERLDRKMHAFREESGVPALALGVVKDGRIVFAGTCGVHRLQSDRAITDESLFHLASVSKPLVATAVLQLAERGKLDLDDRIVDHLPYFQLRDGEGREITIRQVLSHTAGIPEVRDYAWDRPQFDDGAAERYVRGLCRLQPDFPPGDRFAYSNTGYDVLGDLIAKVSGTTFEAYMKEHVFAPLGMRRSTYLRVEVPADLLVWPHVRGPATCFALRPGQVYPYNRAHAPSSTLHSNVGDMLAWCLANLNDGELDGRRILAPGSLNQLWTEHASQDLHDPLKTEQVGSVGLGWFMGSYRGLRMISHGGADPGFRSFVILIPERSIAVVTMGNSDTMRAGQLARAALDLALEVSPGGAQRSAPATPPRRPMPAP